MLRLLKRAEVVAESAGALLFVAFGFLERRLFARSCVACCGDVRLGSVSRVSLVDTAGANSLTAWPCDSSSSSSSSSDELSESSCREASWFNSISRVFSFLIRSRLVWRSAWMVDFRD